MRCTAIVLTLLFTLAVRGPAHAQCMLANPSFEIAGTGRLFSGWAEFGALGSSSMASHGSVAARATSPSSPWGLAGFWQLQDTAPGERWRASVCAWHSATNPITGLSAAVLNIEWRDAADSLISYESHTVVDSSKPVDEIQFLAVESGPAPASTATARIVLGALHAPGEPVHDVYFDQVVFENLGPPTRDDLQWRDFPGGRVLNFRGYPWRVKGPGLYEPGATLFSDADSAVWVDPLGRLHLTIQQISGSWNSTEVTLANVLGYGDYVFTTVGQLDLLHENVVVGMFIWEYGPCYLPQDRLWNPYNEIDVEIGRWANGTDPDVAQFVAQPYDWSGNLNRFGIAYSPGGLVSYAFRWLPDRVEFRSWHGGPQDESPGTTVHAWTYTGPHIPRPDRPRVHINMWQFLGPPASKQEVVFDAFTFVPECFPPHCDSSNVDVAQAPLEYRAYLAPVRPNPLRRSATIRYTLPREGRAEVVVYDVGGRRVHTLVDTYAPAGNHEVVWRGRNGEGARLAPGVYLVRLTAGDILETRRVVLLE